MKATLKSLVSTATPQALANLLGEAKLPLGQKLSEALQKARTNKTVRTIVAIVAIVLIGVVTYLSYVGAGFIFAYGGLVSLIFGVLDVALVALLLASTFKGWAKWGILGFELASFFYFGYTLTGFFGAGGLQSVANKNISEMYAAANDAYYGDANTLNAMSKQLKQSSESIRNIEVKRGGAGLVAEKAELLSGIKLEEVPSFPEPTSAPAFTNLPDGNQWIQSETAKLNQVAQDYQSISKSLIQQAQGFSAGISSALLQSGLSVEQKTNLESMQKTLEQIGKFPLKTPEVSAAVLKPADLKVDGVQSLLGYSVELVTAFFLIILTALSNGKADMEELRAEAGRIIIQDYADTNNLSYDNLEELNYKTLEKVMLMASEENGQFLKYLKTAKVDDVVNFFEKFPVIGNVLQGSKWKFAEVKKAMEADRSLESEMPEIIQISKIDWDLLCQFCEPVQILAMKPEVRTKLLEVIDVLKRKIVNETELKTLIKNLVLGGPSLAYYESLMIFAEKMPANKLQTLTRAFVMEIAPEVSKMIISYVDDVTQLERINSAWSGDDNESYKEILGNGISKDSNFGPLLRILANSSGIDGLRRFASEYKDKHAAATQGGLGEVIAISPIKLDDVRRELKAANPAGVGAALKEILELKPRIV